MRTLGSLLWIGLAVALTLPWLGLRLQGAHPEPLLMALLAGLAIVGAAFLLSWASEVAQLEVSQALAVAVLSLIAILPEYSVDIYFAWRAGQDPAYAHYAVANMTGANRLLIGLGWSAIVVLFWLKTRQPAIYLHRDEGIELGVMALATLYAFWLPLKAHISLLDAVVLIALFAVYVRATAQACRAVLEKCGLEPSQFFRAALYSPDLRSVADVARQAGLDRSQLQDPLLMTVGNAGAAHALLVLAAALDQAQEGQRLLLANYGDGADALVLELEGPLPRPQGRRSVAQYLASKRDLPGYGAFAAMRNLADRPEPRVHSSPVTYWRDVAVELRWHGARCLACGVVQYPIPRVCRECNARDNFQEVKLSRRGTVFTYTLDHLYANEYLDTPIPRAVIDLEGGGRVFLEVTDCDPQEVRWGMTLETTFRRLHEGAEFHNYYWRARPVRE